MHAVLSESNDEDDDDETIQRDNKQNQFLSHNNRKNLRVNDNIISLN